jgi:anti-sigma regulatory factor (Ser/Thr protein kinase)
VAPDEAVAYKPAHRQPETWPSWQPTTGSSVISRLEFPAVSASVGFARKRARTVAVEFGLVPLADTLELIVSEIVTNAVRATRHLRDANLTTPVIRLWLGLDLDSVLIRVWDASSQMPTRQDAGPDDDSGRGLMLVGSLAKEWGAYREEAGKVVWALITLADS